MKITKRKKDERRAFLGDSHIRCQKCGNFGRHYVPPSMGDEGFFICDFSDDIIRSNAGVKTNGKAIAPKTSTQRDRTERRRQSWIADADNDRHTKALKIFRRRNK